MKWIFLIMSIFNIIGAVITAPAQQSQTLVICSIISFSTYCIISEIKKLKSE